VSPIHGVFAPTLRESAQRRSELGEFLKFLRRRVDRDVRVLGRHVRLPRRLGKRVTQEELAEAIGVGREWYVQLERGTARSRPSMGLLHRLADALMLTPEERTILFRLALPEVGRLQLRDGSIAVLEAFSRLRSLSKRLWAATSIEDVLTTASEQVATWFDGALLVKSIRRRESGLWEPRSVDDERERNAAAKVCRDMKFLRPTPELHGAVNYYPQLANAGDLGSPDLWPLPLQREALKVYVRHRVPGFTWRYARVRSRTGFTGGLHIVHEFGHSYSTSDLAVLSAFAEMTSFALS
jgi:transcriptional regulator with XRE-family HTH domain